MIQAALAHCDGGDHRHAQFLRQHIGVQLQPVAGGQVDHVERDHGGQAQRDQLQREAQMIVEVRRVDHNHQRVGQLFAGLLAQHEVAGHLLVGAGRRQAVGAGQVDQFDRPAVCQRQPARLALHRDARIIAQLLPRAGQRVEQGALARIGIADQRDEGKAAHACASCGPVLTSTAAAWLRRIATVMRPILTASGPRPSSPP